MDGCGLIGIGLFVISLSSESSEVKRMTLTKNDDILMTNADSRVVIRYQFVIRFYHRHQFVNGEMTNRLHT